MTDCEKIAGLLSAYYDGELTDNECELVRAHLDECESCAALLRLFSGVTDAFDDIEPPPELRERVMKSVRAVQRHRTANTKRIILWRAIPAAACLAVVLLALPMLANSGAKDNEPMSSGAKKADAASPPMETLMRGEADEDDGADYEIAEDQIYTEAEMYGASLDGAVPREGETGGADADIKTFDTQENARSGGDSSSTPWSPESARDIEEVPPMETPAPQVAAEPTDDAYSVNTARAEDYNRYYVVIKVVGEFPQSLLDRLDADYPIGYNMATREQSVVVSRDIADALIAEGYDYALYNIDASEAIVIAAE